MLLIILICLLHEFMATKLDDTSFFLLTFLIAEFSTSLMTSHVLAHIIQLQVYDITIELFNRWVPIISFDTLCRP